MELLNLGNTMNPIPTPYDKVPQITPQAPQVPVSATPNMASVMNPTGAPAPGAPATPNIPTGPSQKSILGWEKFLEKVATDTNTQQSLMQAGLQMMTPQAAGENAASKILQGTQVGFQGYEQRREADTVNDLRKTTAGEIQARIPGTQADSEVSVATKEDRIAQTGQKTEQNEQALTGGDLDNKMKTVEAQYAERVARQGLAKGEADIAQTNQQIAQSKTYMDYLDQNIRDSEERLKVYKQNGGVTPAQPKGNDMWAQRMAAAMFDPKTNPQEYNQAYLDISNKMLEKKQMTQGDVYMEALKAGRYFEYGPGQATQAEAVRAKAEAFADAWGADPANSASATVPGMPAPAGTTTPSGVTAPTAPPFPGLPPAAMQGVEANIQTLIQAGKTREEAIEIIRPQVENYMQQTGGVVP